MIRSEILPLFPEHGLRVLDAPLDHPDEPFPAPKALCLSAYGQSAGFNIWLRQ
jgi:hypothetical protein